jgi:hypothetical protein
MSWATPAKLTVNRTTDRIKEYCLIIFFWCNGMIYGQPLRDVNYPKEYHKFVTAGQYFGDPRNI